MVKGEKAEITLSTSFEDGLPSFYTLDGSEPSFESARFMTGHSRLVRQQVSGLLHMMKTFSDLAEAYPVFINIVPNYDSERFH